MDKQEANWWRFSITPAERGAKIAGGGDGLREINPTLADGRMMLDYGEYLGLDRLLASQAPSSETPDERVFIITHQLFELAFKMMIFDLSVVTETLRQVLAVGDETGFHELCTATENSGTHEDFWRPALTASSRLKYTSKTLLPAFFSFLERSDGKDETFHSLEFFKFRTYLPPASGLQSAQFRLIQRVFAKGAVFDLKMFPSQEYRHHYEGKEAARELIGITDEVILRSEGAAVANPPETGGEFFHLVRLNAHAHEVLVRLAQFDIDNPELPQMRLISAQDIERAVEGLRLSHAEPTDRAAVERFRQDLEEIAAAENRSREQLQPARRGAFYLHHIAPQSCLALVLNRLVSTDAALHGQHEDSFLSTHVRVASKRIGDVQRHARTTAAAEQPAGTGGGGVPYLQNIRNNLIPLFPFLVAYLNLEDTPAFSWIE